MKNFSDFAPKVLNLILQRFLMKKQISLWQDECGKFLEYERKLIEDAKKFIKRLRSLNQSVLFSLKLAQKLSEYEKQILKSEDKNIKELRHNVILARFYQLRALARIKELEYLVCLERQAKRIGQDTSKSFKFARKAQKIFAKIKSQTRK